MEHVPVLVAVDQYNSWGPQVASAFMSDPDNTMKYYIVLTL